MKELRPFGGFYVLFGDLLCCQPTHTDPVAYLVLTVIVPVVRNRRLIAFSLWT